MATKIEDIEKVYDILNGYSGENGYVRILSQNTSNKKTLNDFQIKFILSNYGLKSRYIGKNVRIAEWWGKIAKIKYDLPFIPKLIEVGYYFGECDNLHVFYGRFRKSQEKGFLIICPTNAFITNFWLKDYKETEVDFSKYNTDKRKILPIQEEAIKFLVTRKKCILANDMGSGKTTSAIVASLESGYKHILVICPNSVKTTWLSELSYYVNEDDITIVNGNKWDDKKFTIINYDILDNFYKIPKQKIKSKKVSLDEYGDIVTSYESKEIVSRNKSIIQDAMSNSQLFTAKYDLIIIDEAHRLSNNSSGRFKIISDLIKRSNPDGIFEITGTMITNSSKNLYNLLKIIDVPVTRDWNRYMERYCSMKSYYRKDERDAYTSIFLKKIHKKSWYDLNDKEKEELNTFLEKKRCKKFFVQGDDSNMEELKEIIKPYYLRRLKSDFSDIVKKEIRCVHYEMTEDEKESYNSLWDEYVKLHEESDDLEKNKKLIEVTLMRQWLADKMIPRTVYLVNKCVELGHKVIVFCAYDNEIEKLREAFDGYCVYHNGKISLKKKDDAVERFQNDENIKVFIGNITSSSVGITLTSGDIAVFNNFSFVPADNLQAEDRIHRLNQTRKCTIYYQSFNGTYFDKMLDIIHRKEDVINKIIVKENEKK